MIEGCSAPPPRRERPLLPRGVCAGPKLFVSRCESLLSRARCAVLLEKFRLPNQAAAKGFRTVLFHGALRGVSWLLEAHAWSTRLDAGVRLGTCAGGAHFWEGDRNRYDRAINRSIQSSGSGCCGQRVA